MGRTAISGWGEWNEGIREGHISCYYLDVNPLGAQFLEGFVRSFLNKLALMSFQAWLLVYGYG